MNPPTQNEEQLFEAARKLTDPAERSAYLDAACAGAPELRRVVERLLAADLKADSFFADGAAALTSSILALPIAEQPGDRIGRYKLLQKIGEGGCGVVYMAEQEEPVRRRVALKIIKLGMDTKSVVARFEAERQALAMMDHENIARVFDAGATDSGRPYFVMELVRGVRITEYCDEQRLTTRERLELFIAACHAVQHAHQKGVIHRDLKPSNILVTINDGVAVPKVIDFGIAKAVQGRLTDQTLFTAFEQLLGTPAYMSPEQALMTSVDVDTRSDIYSLGVLLYELLTGKTPFDTQALLAGGIDELRRTICECEPIRPSTRLQSLPDEELTSAALRRRSEAPKLLNGVSGDLDWIVMKCLEKDRARRYETANGLAMDIKRHLNQEPILARPPSSTYRLQRLVVRNKVAFAAATVVVLALVGGMAMATVGLVRERRARTDEQTQRKRAELASEETRRRAYVAEVNLGFQSLAENNLGRAIELLNRQRPKPGEEDVRGFEWRHLWKLCQSDERATFRDAGGEGPGLSLSGRRDFEFGELLKYGGKDLAFSPDGRWLAYGGDKIVIRELPSQSEVKTIPDATITLAFSPDGKWLASGHSSSVRLWNTESWEEERSLPETRYPAVFSPDRQWLVTGTAGGYSNGLWLAKGTRGGYRIWNTRTWEPMGFCEGGPTFTQQSRHGVAFSPDGKLLVTAGHKGGREVGQFQVWDFPALVVRTNFSSFPFTLGSAVFTPDSKHLLIGDSGGRLMFWDVAEGRVADTREEHKGGITAISFAREGRTFATASSDRTIIIWDAATRKVLTRLRGHLEQVASVAISPDGRTLASIGETTKLWDAGTRHEMRELPGCGVMTGFSADSRLLVASGLKQTRMWRLADGTSVPISLENPVNGYGVGHGVATWSDAYGPDPLAVFGRPNGSLELWNLASMTRLASWRAHDPGKRAAGFRMGTDHWSVETAAFSPDGQFIATSGADGTMKLWDTATHREVRRFPPLSDKLVCLVFSPDGRLLAGSEDNSRPRVGLWDVHEGRLLIELGEYDDWVTALAFSPNGKLLATGSHNSTAQLRDIPSGILRATLKGHAQAVHGVAFSPDGKTLATGGDDRRVKLWNVAAQQEVATLELLRGGCRSLRFSPDGRTLAAGHFLGAQPCLWLWQVPSFEEIATKEAELDTKRQER